jgi:hypothetical protein
VTFVMLVEVVLFVIVGLTSYWVILRPLISFDVVGTRPLVNNTPS